MKVCIDTGGAGIQIVSNLPKCPVPVLMSHRGYQSIQYPDYRTERTEVSSTGIDFIPN